MHISPNIVWIDPNTYHVSIYIYNHTPITDSIPNFSGLTMMFPRVMMLYPYIKNSIIVGHHS